MSPHIKVPSTSYAKTRPRKQMAVLDTAMRSTQQMQYTCVGVGLTAPRKTEQRIHNQDYQDNVAGIYVGGRRDHV